MSSTQDSRTLLSLVLLAVGTLVALYALTHPRWEVLGAALAAAGVVAWTLTNFPYEGLVLVQPFEGNGLTAADLLSGPAAVATVVLCWRSLRR